MYKLTHKGEDILEGLENGYKINLVVDKDNQMDSDFNASS